MIDGQAQTDPDVQLKYAQPKVIIRSEEDPTLSKMTGTVVVKTSWPGIDRRDNEANMYCDSAGRFGTIPHICSYEGVGERREVISNILFIPQEEDIKKYHWPIFGNTAPEKPDVRTFRVNVFSVEGKLLTEARNPQQLSRAFAHFLLGVFIDTLLYPLQLICFPCRVVIDVPVWTPAQRRQPWKHPHNGQTCEEEEVQDTRGVPGPP